MTNNNNNNNIMLTILRYIPHHTILLTTIYAGVCLFVRYMVVPQCTATTTNKNNTNNNVVEEEEECNNEGIDNTVLGWSTDFFVAIVVAILTIHLYMMTNKQKNLCSLAFTGLSIGFLLKGFVTMYFGNSGIDDSMGMKGYYIITMFQYAFWTTSVVFLGMLVQTSWKLLSEGGQVCGLLEYKVAVILNILSAVAVITGCLWGGLAWWNVVPGPFDKYTYEDVDDDDKWIPSELLKIGQLAWHGSYSLCLVAAAYVWGALSKENPVIIGGLLNSVAATGIILAQIALVGIVVYYAVTDEVGISKGWALTESTSISSTLVDYFMMMSINFIHNLLYTFFRDTDESTKKKFRSVLSRMNDLCLTKHDKEKAEDTDENESSEEGSFKNSEDNFFDVEKCVQKSSSTISEGKPTRGLFFFLLPHLHHDPFSSTQESGLESNVSEEQKSQKPQKSALEGPFGGRVVIRSVSSSNVSNEQKSQKSTLEGPCGGRVVIRSVSTSTNNISKEEESLKSQEHESNATKKHILSKKKSFKSHERKDKSSQPDGPSKNVSSKKESLEKSLQLLESITSTTVLQDRTEQGVQRAGPTYPIDKIWQKMYTQDVDLWDDARNGLEIPIGGKETLEEKIRQSITRSMENNEIEIPYNDVESENSFSNSCNTYSDGHIQDSDATENTSSSSRTNEISNRKVDVENKNESRFKIFFWKRKSKKQEDYNDVSASELESGTKLQSVQKGISESDKSIVIQNGSKSHGDTGTEIEMIIENTSTISTQPSNDRKSTEFMGVKKVSSRIASRVRSGLTSVSRSRTENEDNEESIQRARGSHRGRRLSKTNSENILDGEVKNASRASSMRSQIVEAVLSIEYNDDAQTNDDDSSSRSSEDSIADRLSVVTGIELSFDEDYLEQRSIEGGLDHIINFWNSPDDVESTKSSSDDEEEEESVVSIKSLSMESDGENSVASSVSSESEADSIDSATEEGNIGDSPTVTFEEGSIGPASIGDSPTVTFDNSHCSDAPSEEELSCVYPLEHQVNRRTFSSQSRHSRGFAV